MNFKILNCYRTELRRLLNCKSPSVPPPPPQTVCVVSDEDEGFSSAGSGSEKDNTSEYETDLQDNDHRDDAVQTKNQSEKKLSVIVPPESQEHSPRPGRRLSRRLSFFADIDPGSSSQVDHEDD